MAVSGVGNRAEYNDAVSSLLKMVEEKGMPAVEQAREQFLTQLKQR